MLKKLRDANSKGQHICVGLDTDIAKIPPHLAGLADPVYEFNRIIIDETINFAAAYKINLAFYECRGISGVESMMRTLEYLNGQTFTIGDGKRGDIGNTSDMYAKSMFEYFGFDSCTVTPYMGKDSIAPFFNYKERLTYVLALTSNPGSDDLQMKMTSGGKYIFEETIALTKELNFNCNAGLVFGATKSQILRESMAILSEFDLLLPGAGAQGAKIEDIVPIFTINNFNRYLINFSRSLLYCDSSVRFSEFIRAEIKKTDELIRNYI